MSRKRQDGTWTISKEYSGDEDETSRASMYALPVSRS